MDLPHAHAAFLDRALPVWRDDPRLQGVAAGGSLLHGGLDEYSDLDLVLVCSDAAREDVMADRHDLAAAPGSLLQAFTGEHVGEPRLLICLYGPPLLHVDLKFVSLRELAERIEDPQVLWEREGAVRARLAGTELTPEAAPDLQWIEDRFWTWMHYIEEKIARGELLEALDGLGFVRGRVLGPLALHAVGRPPRGVRRLETANRAWATEITGTVARVDAADCRRALAAAVETYARLRDAHQGGPALRRSPAEAPVRAHLRARR